ncbi:MAG TPA: hypothetical protein VN253_23785 [Kofleriaceae bacterium]|nr:hypothetical protein [Kofleriaceae bacterium]
MLMKSSLFAGVALATLVSSTTGRADGSAPAADQQGRERAPAVEASPEMPLPPTPTHRDHGRFSGKRLVVEALAGAVVGSLVGIGVYKAAGGDSIGAAFAGLGSEIALTPVIVWGTGKAMGGRGTLGSAYLGGLAAFAGPSATPQEAAISLAVGMALMPVTSAVIYEVSSHVRSKRFEAVASGVSIAPVAGPHGVSGVSAGLSFGF